MIGRFQFNLRSLFQAIAALALLLAICKLAPGRQMAYISLLFYPVKLLFYLAMFLAALLLFLVPACALAHKLGQCLLGRLPTEQLADAEPIRFDLPPPDDES